MRVAELEALASEISWLCARMEKELNGYFRRGERLPCYEWWAMESAMEGAQYALECALKARVC